MDITEKAKAYADGKALSAITTAIEEAYLSFSVIILKFFFVFLARFE